jgi:hypothetical protein
MRAARHRGLGRDPDGRAARRRREQEVTDPPQPAWRGGRQHRQFPGQHAEPGDDDECWVWRHGGGSGHAGVQCVGADVGASLEYEEAVLRGWEYGCAGADGRECGGAYA